MPHFSPFFADGDVPDAGGIRSLLKLFETETGDVDDDVEFLFGLDS